MPTALVAATGGPDDAGTRRLGHELCESIPVLMKALQRNEGRIYGAGGAAELLGINPTTLASRLRALKITPPKPR